MCGDKGYGSESEQSSRESRKSLAESYRHQHSETSGGPPLIRGLEKQWREAGRRERFGPKEGGG